MVTSKCLNSFLLAVLVAILLPNTVYSQSNNPGYMGCFMDDRDVANALTLLVLDFDSSLTIEKCSCLCKSLHALEINYPLL